MTQAEKLEALVRRAAQGGWQEGWDWLDTITGDDAPEFTCKLFLFNHYFVRALWSWDDSIKCPYCGICLTGLLMHPRPCPFGVAEVFAQPMWQYHLQQAVISENPIGYMYGEVFGDEG